jgi:HAD superfamily hydrolase (TIGR01509 family)
LGPFLYTGAVFDFDGTLLNSEPLLQQGWSVAVAKRGHDFATFDYARIIGLPDHNAAEVVIRHFGLEETPAAFYAEWKAVAEDLVYRYAAPCSGASEVLERFAAEKIPMAVATSAREDYMRRMLSQIGFRKYFQSCRSVDSIGRERGKPKPDIYLEAAADIGSPPLSTIGFEDAPAGVRGLKAAGMFAVGIAADPAMAARLADEGADIVIPSLLNFDWNAIHT